jgi:hypothetical protein
MKKAKKAPAAQPPVAEVPSGLPLFFTRPAALDSERHANAGLRSAVNLSFARKCNSLPLNTIEFIEAARCYPIVFTNEAEPTPVAVLGWERRNPFVTKTNRWRDDMYIPAYVRQYPFVLYQGAGSDKLYLCLDEAAPSFVKKRVKSEKGTLPLYVNGKPSPVTSRALEFANAFYQHSRITRNFCDDLKRHKLLTPYNATVEINGKKQHLNGFLMINETAFNALPQDVFLEFRNKGWLAFIYLALASSINWKRLAEITRTQMAVS